MLDCALGGLSGAGVASGAGMNQSSGCPISHRHEPIIRSVRVGRVSGWCVWRIGMDGDSRQRVGWRGCEWIVIDRLQAAARRFRCGHRRDQLRLHSRLDRRRIMVDQRNQLERRIGERVVVDGTRSSMGHPRDISRRSDRPHRHSVGRGSPACAEMKKAPVRGNAGWIVVSESAMSGLRQAGSFSLRIS